MKNLFLILILSSAACATSATHTRASANPGIGPVFNDDSLQVMSGLILEMGGNGYAGIQNDGTAIACGAVGKSLQLVRGTASMRARAILVFASKSATVRERIQKLPNGGLIITTFKSAVATGIGIAEYKCGSLTDDFQVCCARAQATPTS